VQKDPRGSSGTASEFSSGCVAFANNPRRSSEGSAQLSSGRGLLCSRTQDAHLESRLSARSNKDSLQKNPRRSSGTASEFSSGRVAFANNPRRSSERSAQLLSRRGLLCSRTRDARLECRLSVCPNEDSLQKNLRGSSGTTSEFSSERVGFANNPRCSSEGSAQLSSGQGLLCSRTRDARLECHLSVCPNEDSLQKNPRGSSRTASEFSSEQVGFANNPRRSSEGSSQCSSERPLTENSS
jgi:hypothetical protein